jgi:hypothetical protein
MGERVLAAKFTVHPVAGARSQAHSLLLFIALWRWLARLIGRGYRPERHYMRGAGPKSDKRDPAAVR